MEILKLCMLGVLGVCAAMTLKQWKSDLLPLLRVAILLLFGIAAIANIHPAIAYLSQLGEYTGIGNYVEVLFKALGIAILTQYTAEICRECGENAAASGVELTGKIEILLLCLPLIDEILVMADKLLSTGA